MFLIEPLELKNVRRIHVTIITSINLETYPFPKAEERADERERDRDTEPE